MNIPLRTAQILKTPEKPKEIDGNNIYYGLSWSRFIFHLAKRLDCMTLEWAILELSNRFKATRSLLLEWKSTSFWELNHMGSASSKDPQDRCHSCCRNPKKRKTIKLVQTTFATVSIAKNTIKRDAKNFRPRKFNCKFLLKWHNIL